MGSYDDTERPPGLWSSWSHSAALEERDDGRGTRGARWQHFVSRRGNPRTQAAVGGRHLTGRVCRRDTSTRRISACRSLRGWRYPGAFRCGLSTRALVDAGEVPLRRRLDDAPRTSGRWVCLPPDDVAI